MSSVGDNFDWQINAQEDPPSGPKVEGLFVDDDWTVRTIVADSLARLNQKRPLQLSSTLRSLLDQVGPAVATVLVEHGYFDLDSRSEDAATLERQFRFDKPLTLRFHFFTTTVNVATFQTWLLDPELSIGIDDGYLGYTIVRGRRGLATVGRTLIAAVRPPDGEFHGDFARRVRTRVTEEVNLYGVKLLATGVPFMQQDGALTSCAHVTAWMAHYTGVLRALAPRIPIAKLRSTEMGSMPFGRQFPTHGLADRQTLEALAEGGLAPDIIFVQDLKNPRSPTWHDRPAVHTAGDSHHWHRENFTSTAARYLNSGLPIIMAKGPHVTLICGYLRRSEIANESADPDPGEVDALITHDESKGPYRIVRISEVLEEVDDEDALIVPMPLGLVLSGSDAELFGARAYETHIDDLLGSKNAELLEVPGGDVVSRLVAATKEGMHDHRYAIRTYAAFNSSYKDSLRRRSVDRDLKVAVALMRLPRFVWIVEVIDRELREQRLPPVIGEVVLDATATHENEARPVLVHVPGHIETRDPITGRSQGFVCRAETHNSGRWAQAEDSILWDGHAMSRIKSIGT